MSEYTKYYNLKKPTQSENYNVEDANLNNEIIDNALYGMVNKEPGKGLSTNDFTDNYKKKIDTMQILYRPMGTVDTVQALQSITTKKVGDLYRCKQDQNNYVWNGQEWINIGQDADYSELTHKIEQVKQSQQELIDDMSKTYTGTNIIADTVKGVGRINKVHGFFRQETREGYNLFNIFKYRDAGYSTTISGVTYVVQADGGIKISGTATSNSDFYIAGKWGSETALDTLFNGDYNCSMINNNPSIIFFVVNKAKEIMRAISKSNRYFFLENTDITSYLVRVSAGATVNEVVYPYFYKGTEEKPYEPYGVMPSPDFPSKVHCLGDDVNIYNEETATMSKCLDKTTGNIGTSTASKVSDFMEVEPNESYVVNYTKDDNTRAYVFYNEQKTYICGEVKSPPYIVVAPSNAKYLRIGANINAKDVKIQKGTVATPWSPFGYGSVTNKSETINKFDIRKISLFNSNQYLSTANYTKQGSIRLKKNTNYTIISDTKINDMGLYLYDENGTGGKITYTSIKTGEILKFNSGNNAFLGFYMGAFGDAGASRLTFNNIEDFASKVKVMIVEGEYTASNLPDYVPHEEDTQTTYLKEPLRGIGGVYDELNLSAGKIIRRFDKKVLDGTESGWAKGTLTTGESQYYVSISDKGKALKEPMCTHFVGKVNSLKNHVYINSNGNLLVFVNPIYNGSPVETLEAWKAFLAEQYANGTPVEVVYELATPIIEHIDCSDKITQYDEQTNVYNTDGAELECTLTNNTAIAQTNENLKKIEENRHIIVACINANKTIASTSDERLSLNNTLISRGNLNIEDGKITIGDGILLAKVNAQIDVEGGIASGNRLIASLVKNGTTVIFSNTVANGSFETIKLDGIIEVQKGDKLELYVRNITAPAGIVQADTNKTFITVEAI